MTESKKLNPNWKKRISEIGKKPFEFEEMLKLGFIKPDTDKDKKIIDKAQKKFNKDIDLLSTKEKELNTIKKEIQDAQNTEKLLAEIKQKRIKRSKLSLIHI